MPDDDASAWLREARARELAMQTECPRHRGFLPKERAERENGYYVARCTHIGNRFVVQFNAGDGHFAAVDYVEDLPDDGLLAEPWSIFDLALAPAIWDALVEKLRADIPPDPDSADIVL